VGDQKGASEQIPSTAKAAQKRDDDGGTEKVLKCLAKQKANLSG